MLFEHLLHFLAAKPAFPSWGLEATPMFDVLVDDDESAAGLQYPAELCDGSFDFDGVLQTLGRIYKIEGAVPEWVLREGATAG